MFAVESEPADSGDGGSSVQETYITVNGGTVSVSGGDISSIVTDSISNITADEVNVFVNGDYYQQNSTYLYSPRISEIHMVNNTARALWNPTLDEIPATLHAAIMKQAGIAILYDGWVDLECKGDYKPYGATREAEVLGYDIYAKAGEQYVDGVYQTGGLYSSDDPITQQWALVQLYRAVGVEQVQYYVTTEGRTLDTYNINQSPLVQYLSMDTAEPDLSAVISNVAVTRTAPTPYLSMANADVLGITDLSDNLTVGEFCVLAQQLMYLYGEPVLTEQETYLLLEAYGRDLPYGLSSLQLEAVKYLMARGIVESGMDWRADITFAEAATLLMRIKDEDTRLTLKELQLTTDASLLSKGYYPTEVSTYTSPIEVLDQYSGYDKYTYYDYFIEVADAVQFRSVDGTTPIPFIGSSSNNVSGTAEGTTYMGKVRVGGKVFYHFQVNQTLDFSSSTFLNTVVSSDVPGRYELPLPNGNVGGYWIYTGTPLTGLTDDSTIATWEWHPLDDYASAFPSEYLDKTRKENAASSYTTQLGLFNKSTYGYTIRIYTDDLAQVSYVDASGASHPLTTVKKDATVTCSGGFQITNNGAANNSKYTYFTVEGCDSANTLSEILTCTGNQVYTSFPAFSQQNERYLVAVDYLKAIGVVWEFTKTSDNSYYLGVRTQLGSSLADPAYTDVYIGESAISSYVIRGTQMTIFPQDVAVVWEADGTYYVDYSAVLGIQRAISFTDNNGAISLSSGDQIREVSYKSLPNVNNVLGSQSSTTVALPTVKVFDSTNVAHTYIYAPASYALANWLVVENQIDSTTGIFTFFANPDADSASTGARTLQSMLGLEVSGAGWEVTYTPAPPLGKSTVTTTGTSYDYAGTSLPDILYSPSQGAYLIKPAQLSSTTTYKTWITNILNHSTTPLTSITQNENYLADWNYNLYQDAQGTWLIGYALHQYKNSRGSLLNKLCDMCDWTGNPYRLHASDCDVKSSWAHWVPGAAGVPGLVGYPVTTNSELVDNSYVDTYGGTAYTYRQGSGAGIYATVPSGDAEDPTEVVQYAIIHATEHRVWLQSCGYSFTVLIGSPLAVDSASRPTTSVGGADASFDWGEFLDNASIKNFDDWLTIAIIAVLNLLPRLILGLLILLMALASIANIKPWQQFCDTVIDPYKYLTLGRKDVHTIQLKSVFIYSFIALVLLGAFQNGVILEILAWVADAVIEILST